MKKKKPPSAAVRIFHMFKKIRDPAASDKKYQEISRTSSIPIWHKHPPLEIKYSVSIPLLHRDEMEKQNILDGDSLSWKWNFNTRGVSLNKTVITCMKTPILVNMLDRSPTPQPNNELFKIPYLLHPGRKPYRGVIAMNSTLFQSTLYTTGWTANWNIPAVRRIVGNRH